jgi:hypothetical protein
MRDLTACPAAPRAQITAGNQVTKPCDNATDNDLSRSYGFLLCEAFEANCSTVAVSSKGLMRNCCDSLPVTVPVFATRTFMQDAASVFDYSSEPPPDAVLINLGEEAGSHA